MDHNVNDIKLNTEQIHAEMEAIRPRLLHIKDVIATQCERQRRDPANVRLIAVSKYHSLEAAAAALHLGVEHLAENRVEAFLRRKAILSAYCEEEGIPRPTWHYIGGLQRNKVKSLAGEMDVFHALDSLRLARRINSQYAELPGNQVLPLYLQMNVTGEESKRGFAPAELSDSWHELHRLPHIRIKGLMTMAELDASAIRLHETFQRLASLSQDVESWLKAAGQLDSGEKLRLSMGMSADYEIALAEGATDIRIGSALFGSSQS